MWELGCEESWVPKNWCLWTVVLVKTLESPLDYKEIQPVHPKGHQSWVFIWRTDVESETPVLWPPHAKSWLIGKDFDARRDWEQEDKGTTEDEMAGCLTNLMDMSLSELQELVMDREAWHSVIHGVTKSRTRLSYWTELNWMPLIGPVNLILCHYFCYYLKWVYDNETFTFENTRNCSYGGLGEEISDLHSPRAIRGWHLWLFHQVLSLRAQTWVTLHHGISSYLLWKKQQWVKITTP